MSTFGKIKDFFGVGDDYEDEEDDEYIDDEDGSAVRKPDYRKSSNKGINSDGKVVRLNATTVLQVSLVKPEKFDEVSDIADSLLKKNAVVLNLENVNKSISARILDFLSGVAYANDGQIKRVAKETYIITPYNVDIVGGISAEDLDNFTY